MNITRRSILTAGPVFLAIAATPILAETDARIHVVKDPGCPCCNAWIGHLRENGFNPEELSSCHTATVDDYTIEGHVPAADIRRLLAERPEVVGLSVPGMPFGSPGMGPETEREAYEVLLVGLDGSSQVFTSYPSA